MALRTSDQTASTGFRSGAAAEAGGGEPAVFVLVPLQPAGIRVLRFSQTTTIGSSS
ncbi:hypothetical protein JOC24_004129 [Streptomyces sp. HB132]|nr:hypothetical protein [Streptomyces sp. HB132]